MGDCNRKLYDYMWAWPVSFSWMYQSKPRITTLSVDTHRVCVETCNLICDNGSIVVPLSCVFCYLNTVYVSVELWNMYILCVHVTPQFIFTWLYVANFLYSFFYCYTVHFYNIKIIFTNKCTILLHIKMLKCTVKISHVCSYMFRSDWTIFREPVPNLAKVTILSN